MRKRYFIVAGTLLLAVAGLAPTARATTSTAAGTSAAAASSQTLLAIACPTLTVCYAGGEQGTLLATHDGGATWQSQPYQTLYRESVTPIVSVSCPSADACYALTQAGCDDELGAHVPVLHTSDGGSHWVTTTIQGCGSSLACPNANTCYTAIFPTGQGLPAFMGTTDSGRSWQRRATINAGRVDASLACPTSTECYVAFQNALGRSTDGGKQWSIYRTGIPCTSRQNGCLGLFAIACPSRSTCYAGGGVLRNGTGVAEVITTNTGFRSQTSHLIPGLDNVLALSCPTQSVCYALGSPYGSRVAMTRDGGRSWQVGRITTPYLFDALACPGAGVCYATGYLGRLVATRDGGATWRDLIPAIFLSGTYGASQPPHTYSEWFTATGPWRVAVGKQPGPLGANGRPLPAGCRGVDTVAVYVRNAQNQIVAGPIKAPGWEDRVGRTGLQVTGKLRLDVVSRCSSFSVRVDGVERSQG